jgi:xanthine dehydrogenase/oxidase
MPLLATSPGGQIEFRKTLAMSFFHKFVIYVCNELNKKDQAFPAPDSRLVSCINEIHRPLSHGQQVFTETDGPSAVGKSMKHVSALKQVSGEAVYVEDTPRLHNELYAGIVGSAHANATIL